MGRFTKKIIVICTFVMAAMWLLYSVNLEGANRTMPQMHLKKIGHLIRTPGCTIPDLNPFDKSILRSYSKGKAVTCDSKPPITFVDKAWLRLNQQISKTHYGQELSRCEYQNITRSGGGKSDNRYAYAKPTAFKVDILGPSEFIRVRCFGTNGTLLYTNFHAFILKNHALEKRASLRFEEFKKRNAPKGTLNVLLVGLDSVSRLNFIRQMPKTRDFLLNILGAVEMLGYNKVGSNTFPNLVPIMTGSFEEELHWNSTRREPLDKCNMIWKNFSRIGYRTLKAEDWPGISTFNYLKSGFFKQPTDYYFRPFSLATHDQKDVWRNRHACIASKMETEILLDWVHAFADSFKNDPHFSFSMTTRLTHDDGNRAGEADEPYFRFLTSLHNNNLIDNTFLILFSDHGMRWGPFRRGYIGKMEERLPAMYLVLPKWFGRKHPAIMSNVRTNSKRLTSPFDIHETLKDLLNFNPDIILNRKPGQRRGISLFEEIPRSRVCASAGILSQWCTCLSQKKIDPNSNMAKKAARHLVDQMNLEIHEHNFSKVCEKISVKIIESALKVIAHNDTITKNGTVVEYQIDVRTAPGDGLFETTVRYSEVNNTFTIIGEISRLNKYGDQSRCVDNYVIKKYCFCRL